MLGLLFEDHELQTLHLQRRYRMSEAKEMRKRYELQDQLSKSLAERSWRQASDGDEFKSQS